jgi:hypothetical protein
MWVWLFAVVALASAVQPVSAQGVNAQTVADMLILVGPPSSSVSSQFPTGNLLPAARLSAEVHQQPEGWATSDTSAQPIRFSLFAFRGSPQEGGIDVDVPPIATTVTTTVTGGLYCYRLEHRALLPPNAISAETNSLARFVRLRLMLEPVAP